MLSLIVTNGEYERKEIVTPAQIYFFEQGRTANRMAKSHAQKKKMLSCCSDDTNPWAGVNKMLSYDGATVNDSHPEIFIDQSPWLWNCVEKVITVSEKQVFLLPCHAEVTIYLTKWTEIFQAVNGQQKRKAAAVQQG